MATRNAVNNGVKCAYCKAGYKATYDSGFATLCEKILNCEENGTVIDGCETCASGYAYPLINATKKVDIAECIKVTIDTVETNVPANCLVVEANKCIMCKVGYNVDREGNCARLEASVCTNGYFTYDNKWFTETTAGDKNDSADNNINWRLYLQNRSIGCS
jgi:hypothetical protein